MIKPGLRYAGYMKETAVGRSGKRARCAWVLASVGEMTGLLREPLSADQLRLLRAIFEPFDRSGEWPVWQYVDLTLDAKFGLDAADVLACLPRVGERSPVSVSYGLTWRDNSHIGPQADTRVMLTVAGLRHLGPDTEPLLGSFLVTLRCLADAQRALCRPRARW